MSIIFGWNSFKLKSYDPQALDVPKHEDEHYDYTIERRQRYFHIFFIPFFGIGKFWALRAKNNKLHEPAYHIANHLDILEIRLISPWYTFIGPILLLLAVLGIIGMANYDEYQREKSSRLAYEHKVADLVEKIDHLGTDDYVEFIKFSGKVVYQYGGANQDSLLLLGPRPMGYSENQVSILRKFTEKPILDTEHLWVSKSQLLSTICQDYELSYGFKGAKLERRGRNNRLITVHRINGPNPSEINFSRSGSEEVILECTNKGLTGTILRLVPVSGEITWHNEFPIQVIAGKRIKIKGTHDKSPNYEFDLICKTIHDTESHFRFKHIGSGQPTVKRINLK